MPEDNINRRLTVGLAISLVVNLAAMAAVSTASARENLPSEQVLAPIGEVEFAIDDAKQLAVKPDPNIVKAAEQVPPKPEVSPQSPTRVIEPNPVRVVRRTREPRVRITRNQPQITRTATGRVRPTTTARRPDPRTTTITDAGTGRAVARGTTSSTSPTAENNIQSTVGGTNVTSTPTRVARAGGSGAASNAVGSAAESLNGIGVSTTSRSATNTRAGSNAPGTTGVNPLAGTGGSNIASATERSTGTGVAGSNFSPTAAPGTSTGATGSTGVGATVGVAKVGTGATASGLVSGTAVAAISTPSFVTRRGAAIGNSSVTSNLPSVMTSTLEEGGRANSGFATIQGGEGTVARSVSVGKVAVSDGGGGGGGGAKVGNSGAGARGSAEVGALAINTPGGGGTSLVAARGAAGGGGGVSDKFGTGTGVGAASDAGRGDGTPGARGAGNDLRTAAAGAARDAGGGGGPAGVGGAAKGVGNGGKGVGGSAVGKVDLKNDAKEDIYNGDTPKPRSDNKTVDATATRGSSQKVNRDAERTYDPDPELSSEMKKREFNTKVEVEITVDVDGSHTERLITDSGFSDIDALVLKAMRRWKWKPSLRDGIPQKQTFKFRYTINVRD
jgi:TonB family protein